RRVFGSVGGPQNYQTGRDLLAPAAMSPALMLSRLTPTILTIRSCRAGISPWMFGGIPSTRRQDACWPKKAMRAPIRRGNFISRQVRWLFIQAQTVRRGISLTTLMTTDLH